MLLEEEGLYIDCWTFLRVIFCDCSVMQKKYDPLVTALGVSVALWYFLLSSKLNNLYYFVGEELFIPQGIKGTMHKD